MEEVTYLSVVWLSQVVFAGLFLLVYRYAPSRILQCLAAAWLIEGLRTSALLAGNFFSLPQGVFWTVELLYLPVTVLILLGVGSFLKHSVPSRFLWFYLPGSVALFFGLRVGLVRVLPGLGIAPDSVAWIADVCTSVLLMVPGALIRGYVGLEMIRYWRNIHLPGSLAAGITFLLHGLGSLKEPLLVYFSYFPVFFNMLWFVEVLITSIAVIVLVFGKQASDLGESKSRTESNERKYRTLLENLRNGIILCRSLDRGRTFQVKAINRIALENCEENGTLANGRRLEDLFPWAAELNLTEVCRTVWLSGKTQTIPATRWQAKRWIEAFVFTLPTGEVVVDFDDVSERIESTRKLAYERFLLDTLLQNTPDRIYFKDRSARFVRVSRSMAEFFGCTPEELIGKSDFDFFQPELAKEKYRMDCKVINGEQVRQFEEPDITKDGKKHWIITTKLPWISRDGSILGLFGISRDITERKKLENKLQQAHEETGQLLASISGILISLDTEGRVTHWNSVAKRLLGLDANQVLGRYLSDCRIRWDWEAVRNAMETSRSSLQSSKLIEVSFKLPDSDLEGLLGIKVNPILSDQQEITGWSLLGTDLTERRLLEAQLHQAQKLESIGQLAAGIAHEINTPTQFIGDNLAFLQDSFGELLGILNEIRKLRNENGSGKTPEELWESVEQVDFEFLKEEVPLAITQSLEGVDRIRRIVGAMRDFSHPGSEERKVADINRLIDSTVTVARNEWKYVAEVQTDFEADLPHVSCLPAELNQVFLNILVNAAHAISDKLKETGESKGRIHISTSTSEGCVEIRIRDSGPGIPENIINRIFDPFFTTKEVGKGTGQGLSIAYSIIVERHGGTLEVESEPGKGATFIIRLPLESNSSESRLVDAGHSETGRTYDVV